MDNIKKPKAPLCLRKAKAAEEICNSVNAIAARYEVPPFIMDDILFRICAEVRAEAQKELDAAMNSYAALLNEYNKNCENNEENKVEEVDVNA